MERLSDRAIEIINELHTERLDYESEYLPLIDCANKCSAYEDTGLEPETVSKIRDIVLDISGNLDRLRELAEADREGRCVVLPRLEPGQGDNPGDPGVPGPPGIATEAALKAREQDGNTE